MGTQAVSVTYTSGGVSLTIGATKEVILCAGAFQSPQLVSHHKYFKLLMQILTVLKLMLSGIGPAAELQKFGYLSSFRHL